MKDNHPLSADTLLKMKQQFPTHNWSDSEVQKLLNAEHGVITGFQDILDDLNKLMDEDLGETPPMTSGRPSSKSPSR